MWSSGSLIFIRLLDSATPNICTSDAVKRSFLSSLLPLTISFWLQWKMGSMINHMSDSKLFFFFFLYVSPNFPNYIYRIRSWAECCSALSSRKYEIYLRNIIVCITMGHLFLSIQNKMILSESSQQLSFFLLLFFFPHKKLVYQTTSRNSINSGVMLQRAHCPWHVYVPCWDPVRWTGRGWMNWAQWWCTPGESIQRQSSAVKNIIFQT